MFAESFIHSKLAKYGVTGVAFGNTSDQTTWKLTFSGQSTDNTALAYTALANYDYNSIESTLSQIALLEASITKRRDLDYQFNNENPTGWMANTNSAIATLRAKLPS